MDWTIREQDWKSAIGKYLISIKVRTIVATKIASATEYIEGNIQKDGLTEIQVNMYVDEITQISIELI